MTPSCTLAAFATAMALAAGGCSDADDEGPITTDCTETSAATVESFARAPIPESATTIEVFCSGFTDIFVRARIVLPRRDLDVFLDDAHFSAPPRRGVRPFTRHKNDPATWKIAQVKRVLGHEEECAQVKTLVCKSGLAGRRVIVDLDTPGRATVYLQAYTT